MRRGTRAFAAVLVAASVILTSGGATLLETEDEADSQQAQIRSYQYWLDSARIEQAWQFSKGAGVTIAVIDTGIGRVPADFEDAVIGGTDVSGVGSADGRRPVGIIDGDHGSWVASLAAARGNPGGTRMIGVAPEAKLLSISLGFTGSSATVPFYEQLDKAMRWAVDNGADVINLSFTTNTLDWHQSWDAAFQYAYDHDVVVVVAAGNRGSGTTMVGAPATIPGVLTVAGVDRNGIASQSASTQGITIGISAPSEELLGVSADGSLAIWNGTSGAAPIVAGVAALVRSAHPELDANNVINRIIKSAIPVAGVSKTPDPLYGYGLLDAYTAVTGSFNLVSKNPMGDLAEWVRLNRRADIEPTPTPELPPVTVEPLPPAEPPTQAASPFFPNEDSLRYGTIPLVGVTLAGILVVLGGSAIASRRRAVR